jgi:hypothetical protein
MDKLARTIAAALKVLNPTGKALSNQPKQTPGEKPTKARPTLLQ